MPPGEKQIKSSILLLTWSVLASAANAQVLDLNAVLCESEGWEYDKQYVSVSRQAVHVRGSGTGLLFEYTRNSKDLWDEEGEFNNSAYRPAATKKLPGLDLSEYVRLSFWIYVEGNAEEAFQWGLQGTRPFRLSCRRGKWFHAHWYLDEAGVALDNVQQIVFAGVNPDYSRL